QAGGARLAQVVPDRGLRADVHAPGGVGGQQHRRVAAHLPADDELLLVAAAQRVGEHVDAGGAHVVGVDDAPGVGAGAGGVDAHPAGVGPFALVAEDAVLP